MIRRTWSPRGKRPIARQRPRYKWLYVYAFVRPSDGEVFWLLMPTVNVEAFEAALEAFARFAGAGPDHEVLLVLDGAGWHTSKRLQVPPHVHLHFLPPYSPQLQPAERLWPLLHEAIANKPIDDLDQLEAILVDRCNALDTDKRALQRLTEFAWWREAVHPIV